MRLGLLELGAIILIVIVVLLVSRFVPTKPRISETSSQSGRTPKGKTGGTTTSTNRILQASGVSFLAVGLVLLLVGIALFRWVLWIYLFALAILGVGLAVVLISRKR